ITAGAGAAVLSINGGVFDMSGDNATGTFQVNGGAGGALVLSGGTLCFDVGSSSDTLLVNGSGQATVFGSSAINITGLSSIKSGTYTLVSDAAGGLTGGFASTPNPTAVTVGGKIYNLTLSGNDTEEDVIVSTVSTNNSLLALSAGSLAMSVHMGDTTTLTTASVTNSGTDAGSFT
ncbi:MAG: hypothetical protein ABSG68_19790, partial [Thermoguttaceae bacterium]